MVLQSSFSETPAVRLGDSDLITVGEEIVALGSPYGLEGTVSTGILSGIRPIDGVKYIQITAPISPGSSGGPIISGNGVVIGVATASIGAGQNLNFALPANLINQLPHSDHTFASAKYVQPSSEATKNLRDLVFANNVIAQTGPLDAQLLLSITFSIQNKTNQTACNFRVLVIIKKTDEEVLDYKPARFTKDDDCVAAGLAKQFTVPTYTMGYPGYDSKTRRYPIEIRILDFTVRRNQGSPLDDLFKKP